MDYETFKKAALKYEVLLIPIVAYMEAKLTLKEIGVDILASREADKDTPEVSRARALEYLVNEAKLESRLAACFRTNLVDLEGISPALLAMDAAKHLPKYVKDTQLSVSADAKERMEKLHKLYLKDLIHPMTDRKVELMALL